MAGSPVINSTIMQPLFKYTKLSGFLFLFIVIFSPASVRAQEKEQIGNEYRLTLVPTYAFSKQVFFTTYVGYVYSGGSKTNTIYLGAPGVVSYRVNNVIELCAGSFLIGNYSKEIADNTELRPLAGLKLVIPNKRNLHLYNWTRYEMRNFYYDDKNQNNTKHRIRNRIAVEFPISHNAWEPKSFYGMADFEFFYTFSKDYIDRYRQRFGLGYVIDKNWKAEFIYHIQLLRASEVERPEYTDNIFRLNFKWTIPHKNKDAVQHNLDLDE